MGFICNSLYLNSEKVFSHLVFLRCFAICTNVSLCESLRCVIIELISRPNEVEHTGHSGKSCPPRLFSNPYALIISLYAGSTISRGLPSTQFCCLNSFFSHASAPNAQ